MVRLLRIALLLQVVCAEARQFVVLEDAQNLPEHWKFSGMAPDNEKVSLQIALKQPRMDDLKARLVAISSPDHPEFGNHLEKTQLTEYQRPAQGSVDAVSDWLESSGVTEVRAHDHWISFNTTVAQARAVLGAELGYYAYSNEDPVLRARRYQVPVQVQGHIDFIFPLAHFMPPVRSHLRPQPQRNSPGIAALKPPDEYLQCSRGVQPECLKKLYGINYTAPEGPSPSRFGIAGFLEESISYADVQDFMSRYAWELPPSYSFKLELVNNATNVEEEPGLEASLDVQYGMAVGYPAQVTYYITGGRGAKLDGDGKEIPISFSDNEPYLEFLQHLLAKPDDEIPHVISISYADDEQGVPRAYAGRVCDLFAQLTARGVSILAATGDGGSTGTGQMKCYSNDGEHRRMVHPTFPASCPWVTAVGATSNEGLPIHGAEFSTGGFSNYFGRPKWQERATRDYVAARMGCRRRRGESEGPERGMFNASGRAIPDISAVGTSYVIHKNGMDISVQGTSASTPVIAAMVALVNDARLRAGKNSTGWLNPTLYSTAMKGAMRDITDGRSRGCWYGEEGTVPGWPAAVGYDAITGLGTPDTFEKFLGVLG